VVVVVVAVVVAAAAAAAAPLAVAVVGRATEFCLMPRAVAVPVVPAVVVPVVAARARRPAAVARAPVADWRVRPVVEAARKCRRLLPVPLA
jgi:hypothetical protein